MIAPVGHYSHVSTHEGLAFISGQLPIAEGGEHLSSEPFARQVCQVLFNVDACLRCVGGDRRDLVHPPCQ
ncbi:RidA family protein [Aurantimonas sp. C2-5-R2]|uniref:RidA family protein n=1 Tax=Aurantimonas sp. C2-5-R2 TaxID=3113713 RepID=UPI003FA5490C